MLIGTERTFCCDSLDYLLPSTLCAVINPGTSWCRVSPFGLYLIGFGLLSTLDQHTSTAIWATFLAILALGSGMLGDTMLPVFQATLVSEKDQAAATAAWSFLKTFGKASGDFLLPARYSTVLPTSTRALLRTLWREITLSTAGHLQAGPKK